MTKWRTPWQALARLALGAVLIVACAATAGWAWERGARTIERRFPHEKHARLFPACESCHDGIMAGDPATSYPAPVSCAECHDGTRQRRVTWDGPAVAPSNLRFSHAQHDRVAEKETPALTCRTCHATGESTTFMAVARATPERCLGCHTHRATGHLSDDAACARCHAPLSRAARLSDSAVAAIAIPDGHGRPGFLEEHAPASVQDAQRCATCHARESCARCHPNVREVAQLASLERDARVARVLRGRPPSYFRPASHGEAKWIVAHGDSAARLPTSCANCHARPSCQACHIGRLAAREVGRLAGPDGDGAPGVQLRLAAVDVGARAGGLAHPHTPVRTGRAGTSDVVPPVVPDSAPTARRLPTDTLRAPADTSVRLVRLHPADFVDRHGTAASSGQLNCLGCHEERTCTTCHNGASRGRFHPFNFLGRHAATAAGRERDCSSCHSTETFCRECHRGQGREARGSGTVAYHDRQPLWLQQHGQAARQEMQSCASCHQQRDCMRCHSDLGLRVNPHGPGFDAGRMASRNRQLCLACHLNDPLRGRP